MYVPIWDISHVWHFFNFGNVAEITLSAKFGETYGNLVQFFPIIQLEIRLNRTAFYFNLDIVS
jgi:hypothetical protein